VNLSFLVVAVLVVCCRLSLSWSFAVAGRRLLSFAVACCAVLCSLVVALLLSLCSLAMPPYKYPKKEKEKEKRKKKKEKRKKKKEISN